MSFNNFAEVFERRATERPDAPCLVFHRDGGWRTWTYAEVSERAVAVAGGLVALGIAAGDRVAIFSENCPEWVLADLGGILAAAVVVSVYPSLTAEEAGYIIGHSESRVVFAQNAGQAAKVLSIRDTLPRLEQIIVFDGSAPTDARVIPLSELGALARPEATAVRRAVARALGPDDVATLVYTSGTTGAPKGAVLTHGNVVRTVESSLESVGDSLHIELALRLLPLAHVLERMAGHFAVIYSGACAAQVRSIDTFGEDVKALRPDFLALVPRVYEKAYAAIHTKVARDSAAKQKIFRWAMRIGIERSKLLEVNRAVPFWLAIRHRVADKLVFARIREGFGGRVRFLGSGGAPLSPEIARFFHAAGLLILEAWGLTETSAPATSNRPDAFRFGTVGRALPRVEVKTAEDGELLVRGVNVFREYFKDAAATEAAFDPDGFFRTGDIGTIDTDGFITITDRKKEIIITAAGKNIAPQKLENLLRDGRVISNAMVHCDGRPYVVALVTVDNAAAHAIRPELANRPATDPGIAELVAADVAAANSHLARFEQVKYFRIVEREFSTETGELTPSLKLKRRVIQNNYRHLLDAMYESATAVAE